MRVRYTSVAAAELSDILAFVSERSPRGARSILLRLEEIERLLSAFPEAGRPTRLGWLRRIALGPYPYVVQYEATGSEIVIHNIRHAARREGTDRERP